MSAIHWEAETQYTNLLLSEMQLPKPSEESIEIMGIY